MENVHVESSGRQTTDQMAKEAKRINGLLLERSPYLLSHVMKTFLPLIGAVVEDGEAFLTEVEGMIGSDVGGCGVYAVLKRSPAQLQGYDDEWRELLHDNLCSVGICLDKLSAFIGAAEVAISEDSAGRRADLRDRAISGGGVEIEDSGRDAVARFLFIKCEERGWQHIQITVFLLALQEAFPQRVDILEDPSG